MENRERVIVFAGDSTTDADKLNTADRLGVGYVRQVNDNLGAFRPWVHNIVINAGVSGNTSRDLLARWDEDVLAKGPEIVFCMIGINDVWRHFDLRCAASDLVSAEEYGRNVAEMAEKSAAVKDFYFMTPYYMERNRQDEMRAMTEEYAAVMRRVAEKYCRPVVDIQAAFDGYMRYRPGQSVCWDRVHPDRIGALLIAREVLRVLEAER